MMKVVLLPGGVCTGDLVCRFESRLPLTTAALLRSHRGRSQPNVSHSPVSPLPELLERYRICLILDERRIEFDDGRKWRGRMLRDPVGQRVARMSTGIRLGSVLQVTIKRKNDHTSKVAQIDSNSGDRNASIDFGGRTKDLCDSDLATPKLAGTVRVSAALKSLRRLQFTRWLRAELAVRLGSTKGSQEQRRFAWLNGSEPAKSLSM